MSDTARPNWTMVRLTNGTLAKLRALAAKWYHCSAFLASVPGPDDRGHISIDRVVEELLRRDEGHRTRAKAQSARTRGIPRSCDQGVYTGVAGLTIKVIDAYDPNQGVCIDA